MSKVLELLGPGEVEETLDPAADTTAVIESQPASGPDGARTSHRITLRTADGEEKIIEGSRVRPPASSVANWVAPRGGIWQSWQVLPISGSLYGLESHSP